jgi:hypothetical protein
MNDWDNYRIYAELWYGMGHVEAGFSKLSSRQREDALFLRASIAEDNKLVRIDEVGEIFRSFVSTTPITIFLYRDYMEFTCTLSTSLPSNGACTNATPVHCSDSFNVLSITMS